MKKLLTILSIMIVTFSSLAFSEVELTVTAEKNSGNHFYAKRETKTQTYYYLNVTVNNQMMNTAYNLLFTNLDDTDYLEYKVKVISESGKVFDEQINLQSEDQGIGDGKSFDISFIPAIDETGICDIILYSKNKSETDYSILKEFDNIKVVPQHVILRDLPGTIGYNGTGYDYTIFYTDDFFTGLTKITKSTYLEIIDNAFVDMWQKLVADWKLAKGVEYEASTTRYITDLPKDLNENVQIVIYDGLNNFHCIEKTNDLHGQAFTYFNKNDKRLYFPTTIFEDGTEENPYLNATDKIYTEMANNLFKIIQQSLNEENDTPVFWMYNGAALAMQSIATQYLQSEFKNKKTDYAQYVNQYLANTDQLLIPNNGDLEASYMFALYWRFLFENIIPDEFDGNYNDWTEEVEIFRIAYKYAQTGDFTDLNSYMNKALHEIEKSQYRTFNHSWTAFAEKLLYISGSDGHWGRWFDNANKIYNTPTYGTSYYFDFTHNYSGYIKSSIENAYGINLHKFDNNEFFPKLGTKNLNFEFVGDGDADWAVVVQLNKTDNYGGVILPKSNPSLQKIEGSAAVSYVLPIEKFKNKKRARFNLRELFGHKNDVLLDVEEMKIAIVRLDDDQDNEANYSIGWKEAEDMTMYIVSPVHENPAIIELQNESYLDIRFTVIDAEANFVNNLNTSRLNLITENGKMKYNLTITDAGKETSSYTVRALLPTDLPAGLYSLEIEAQDPTDLNRYFKGFSPYSLLIRNDYGCSGQELELVGTYEVGIVPEIRFDLPEGTHPSTILDINYPNGQEVVLPLIITDDGTIANARLYFKRNGTDRYFYYGLERSANDDTKFTATIPDSIAVAPGCDFYIWAMDNDGRISTYPKENPWEYPFKLAVGNLGDSTKPSTKPIVNVLNEPALTLLSFDNPIKFEVEVRDSNNYIEEVGMYYRIEGELFWRTKKITLSPVAKKTIEMFEIPAGFSGMKPIEYAIYAVDNFGLVGYYGSKNFPKYLDFQIPAPELFSPMNNDTIVAYETEFEWEDLESLYGDMAYFYEYQIEISKTEDFTDTNLVTVKIVEDPFAILENLEYEREYFWRVKAIIDSYESDYSEIYRYYVAKPIPVIEGVSVTEKICVNELLYLEVVCNLGDWNYQWFKNDEIIPGANEAHFMVESATMNDAALYYCIVSNKIETDSATSEIVEVIVYDKPFILSSPKSTKVQISGKAFFELELDALGFAPDNLPKVEWYRGGTKLENDHDKYVIFFEEASGLFKLIINDVNMDDYSDRYFVKIIDRCDPVVHTTEYFALEMQKMDPPYITLHPESIMDCAGEAVMLQARIKGGGNGQGTPTYTYQWYRDDNAQALIDDAVYSGTTTDELTIKSLQESFVGRYYAKITVMPYDTVLTTEMADVKIRQAPKIVNQSADTVGTDMDKTVVLYVIAEGDDLNYQWYYNNSKVAGATSHELVIQKFDFSQEGTYYCEVWNDCGNATTKEIEVVDVEDEIIVSDFITVSPNPIANDATITINIEQSSNVSLKLVDELGKEIAKLKDEYTLAGTYNISLDIRDYNVLSGKYFILLQYGSNSVTVPIIIVN